MLLATLLMLSFATPVQAAADLDPCSLLTSDEIKAVIKEKITKTEKGKSQDGTLFCHWYGDDKRMLQKGISVMVHPTLGKEMFEANKMLVTKLQPVSGAGDAAYTDAEQKTGIALYKGKVYLTVSPVYKEPSIGVEQCKSLALKALGRMK